MIVHDRIRLTGRVAATPSGRALCSAPFRFIRGWVWVDAEGIRTAVSRCLWPQGQARRPASAEWLGTATTDDARIDDLRIRSPQNPQDPIPAFLSRPRTGSGPFPTILCLPGSNGDRHLLAGDVYGATAEGILRGWARELARRGYASLAVTHRCRPERGGNFFDWAKAELLCGRTAMGGLIEDALSAVDVLQARPDVVRPGLGAIGFSLGGITAFYAAVIDPRLAATVTVCGGVGSLAALIDHGALAYHSAYYFVPGLLCVGDHDTLLEAVAPRGLLVLGREEDPGMPVDGLRALGAVGRRVYSAAPDGFAVAVRPGGHLLAPEDIDAADRWLAHRIGRASD